MILNEHVNVDTEYNQYVDKFTPDDGYALWRDDEESNLDENGNPLCYWKQMQIQKRISEAAAPHIWARLIDDTMEVYGGTDRPSLMSLNDENNEEYQKKGVY